jgi:ABC-type polysaccharide/polyol phosphate export permease
MFLNEAKRIIKYRELLLILTWREFSIRYKYSIIGALWSVVQPITMMLLFLFIYSYVLHVKVSEYPPMLFYYMGLMPWVFFSSSLNYSIPSLTNHYQLITKIYFPRELLPLSGILVALADFLIASVLFIIFLLFYDIKLTINVLWFFPLMLQLMFFTVFVSIFLAGLNVYYRDIKLAASFLLQLWFFASPVMYSIDQLDLKIKLILFLNPLTFIIENMRRCVLEGRAVVLWQFAFVSVVTLIFSVIIYRFFVKIERSFSDVI